MDIPFEVRKYWDFEYSITPEVHPDTVYDLSELSDLNELNGFSKFSGKVVDNTLNSTNTQVYISREFYNDQGVIYNPIEHEPSMMKRAFIKNEGNEYRLFFSYYWMNKKAQRHRLCGPAAIERRFTFKDGDLVYDTLEEIYYFHGVEIDSQNLKNWLKESGISLDNLSEPDKVLMRMKFNL